MVMGLEAPDEIVRRRRVRWALDDDQAWMPARPALQRGLGR